MNRVDRVKKLAGQRISPCAFCGVQPSVAWSMGLTFILCDTTNCPASSTQNMTKDEQVVIDRWNRRKASTTS